MTGTITSSGVGSTDGLGLAELKRAWVEGWVVSRAAAPPVEEPWGFTVDVGLVPQVRRYVLPDADEALVRMFVRTVTAPGTWIKCFLEAETVAAWLAPGWELDAPGFLMATRLAPGPEPRCPGGYRLRTWTHGGLTRALVTTGDHAFAARGQIAVPAPGAAAVIDQIETAPGHRRHGLGSLVMRTLCNAAAAAGSPTAVLGATTEGRALYEHLGWTAYGPLTGAVLSPPAEPSATSGR
ncbi:GNAT family N-acetyltransferase [Streptomyces sp. NPDC004031]